MGSCLSCHRSIASARRHFVVRGLAGRLAPPRQYPAVFRLLEGTELCALCLEQLPLLEEPCCGVCGRSVAGLAAPRSPLASDMPAGTVCEDCRAEPSGHLVMNRSVLRYGEWSRDMIRLLKYRGDERLAGLLARLLAVGYVRHFADTGISLITGVPLHPAKQERRGFNQAELLARGLSRLVKLPVRTLLVRIRETEPLSRMSGKEARRTAVEGAFALAEGGASLPVAAAPSVRVLLIDDIYTTGATVRSCARAIGQAPGWSKSEVYALTLCR